MPIIMFSVLLSMFSAGRVDPVFSLVRSRSYAYERTVSVGGALDVPYYVRDKSLRHTREELAHLERDVLHQYDMWLRKECDRETHRRKQGMRRAALFKDDHAYEVWRSRPLQMCDQLASFSEARDTVAVRLGRAKRNTGGG